MKVKKRLDVLLVERGLSENRTKAQAVIMSGLVDVNGQRADKPGVSYEETVDIQIRGAACPYVSRGGLKLEKALRDFGVHPVDYVCSDSGASTGGFTDCLLQQGAKKVFAIDVGYGQLAWKLRQDPRVVNLERTNVRFLEADSLGELVDCFTIDVAFISLDKVLPSAYKILKPDGFGIALIKPQFEAGREKVGKKGVVRDPAVHLEVIEKVIGQARELGFVPLGLDFSPIRGPEGNIEYLFYMGKQGEDAVSPERIREVVAASHETLEK